VEKEDLAHAVQEHDARGLPPERVHGLTVTWGRVITKDEAVVLLVGACPSFHARDESLRGRAVDSELWHYEQMSAFAHHLVRLAERGETSELPAVFDLVERLLVEGDPAAVLLLRSALVEDLQNITSHRDIAVGPDDFRSMLGPVTIEVWDELDLAWSAAAEHPTAIERSSAEEFLYLAPDERRRVQSMTRELADGTLESPSDVLRYEAHQYDEELTRMEHFLRASPAVYVMVAATLIVALWFLIVER
jgi:hypothetical protein